MKKKSTARKTAKGTAEEIRRLIPLEVVDAIWSERLYQEAKYPNHTHTIGEWLLIQEQCLLKAKAAWVNGHGNNVDVLDEIRQVTAVGVAAMAECGSFLRPPYKDPGEDSDDMEEPLGKG